MPTYEYVCKECGETLEVFQKFSDKPLKTHAACGGALQKVFHVRGIVFKGDGFYATDSKSSRSTKTSGEAEPAKKEKAGAKASSSTTSTDSD